MPRHSHHAPRSTHTHTEVTYARHPRSHAARSSSWPAHERPVLLDERRDKRRADAPPARACAGSVRHVGGGRRLRDGVERRDGVDRRAPQAARRAARLEVEAVPADVLAQRAVVLACAPEMRVWMRGGGAIILEGAIPRRGGRAGRKNCARRAPRAPTSSSTARRASRSSSSAEGSPLVIRSHPSLRMTLSKSERRWTARGSGSSVFDDPTARRSVVDPRGASAGGFRRVSEVVASSLSPFIRDEQEVLEILKR